jgi:hypothetical protein
MPWPLATRTLTFTFQPYPATDLDLLTLRAPRRFRGKACAFSGGDRRDGLTLSMCKAVKM